MEENLIRKIGPEAELRERAHEVWNHRGRALFVAAQDALAKDPFAPEFVDSETKVEIDSICKPVCITVSFDHKTLGAASQIRAQHSFERTHNGGFGSTHTMVFAIQVRLTIAFTPQRFLT